MPQSQWKAANRKRGRSPILQTRGASPLVVPDIFNTSVIAQRDESPITIDHVSPVRPGEGFGFVSAFIPVQSEAEKRGNLMAPTNRFDMILGGHDSGVGRGRGGRRGRTVRESKDVFEGLGEGRGRGRGVGRGRDIGRGRGVGRGGGGGTTRNLSPMPIVRNLDGTEHNVEEDQLWRKGILTARDDYWDEVLPPGTESVCCYVCSNSIYNEADMESICGDPQHALCKHCAMMIMRDKKRCGLCRKPATATALKRHAPRKRRGGGGRDGLSRTMGRPGDSGGNPMAMYRN